jgi:hypothetical protein
MQEKNEAEAKNFRVGDNCSFVPFVVLAALGSSWLAKLRRRP